MTKRPTIISSLYIPPRLPRESPAAASGVRTGQAAPPTLSARAPLPVVFHPRGALPPCQEGPEALGRMDTGLRLVRVAAIGSQRAHTVAKREGPLPIKARTSEQW